MGFSGVNLTNVETSFVGEGEVPAIAGDCGRPDTIIGGIGSQLRSAEGRVTVLLRQEQAELYPEKNEDDCGRASKNPPDVKTCCALGSGLHGSGLGRYSAVAIP